MPTAVEGIPKEAVSSSYVQIQDRECVLSVSLGKMNVRRKVNSKLVEIEADRKLIQCQKIFWNAMS